MINLDKRVRTRTAEVAIDSDARINKNYPIGGNFKII
jgi:hypothetical protein